MGKIITAIILAGGKGERLRPVTNTLPKPMVTIDNNKPLLEWIINNLKKYNISNFIFTVCYKAGVIKNYFGDGKKLNVNISYFTEDENNPLGTAGAVGLLGNQLHSTFIVSSADIVQRLNINDILSFHKKRRASATICVYRNTKKNPKSIIKFDKNKRIASFEERPKKIPIDGVWSNASFYIFEPDIINFIPKNTKSDFGKDVFPKLLKANKKVYAYIQDKYFMDIGNIEKLEKVRSDMQKINL